MILLCRVWKVYSGLVPHASSPSTSLCCHFFAVHDHQTTCVCTLDASLRPDRGHAEGAPCSPRSGNGDDERRYQQGRGGGWRGSRPQVRRPPGKPPPMLLYCFVAARCQGETCEKRKGYSSAMYKSVASAHQDPLDLSACTLGCGTTISR